MPIGPKRSGSAASMMQYTYLPRLALALASAAGIVRPACTVFSDVRLSTLPRAAGLAGAFATAPPFGFQFAARPCRTATAFLPTFGGGADRERPPFCALALGIFAA